MSNPNAPELLFKEESLAVVGYHEEHVPNTFFRQTVSARHLAIILPGAGYSARMPILYYTASLFLERRADILTVDYDYRSHADRYAADFEERLTENVTAAIREALGQRTYEQVTLIGKSIGTRAMSLFLAKDELGLNSAIKLKTVWLTPIWSDPKTFSFMKAWPGEALHIIGSADQSCYSEECEEQLIGAKNIRVLTIKNADHSLDIDGDITGSLNAVQAAVRGIEKFLFGSSKI